MYLKSAGIKGLNIFYSGYSGCQGFPEIILLVPNRGYYSQTRNYDSFVHNKLKGYQPDKTILAESLNSTSGIYPYDYVFYLYFTWKMKLGFLSEGRPLLSQGIQLNFHCYL